MGFFFFRKYDARRRVDAGKFSVRGVCIVMEKLTSCALGHQP